VAVGTQALCSQTQDPDTQHWVLTILLPWVYWHQQTEKTRHTELKQGYHQTTQQAHARFLAHSFTHTETLAQQQQWIDWAIWMCAKFSASSAVEGRNGYLSRLHHSHQGFTEQTLKVLTVIHNFDLKRDDDTTAAQRLFGKPFPNLFDWVVLNDYPDRANKKARISKAHRTSCPVLSCYPS